MRESSRRLLASSWPGPYAVECSSHTLHLPADRETVAPERVDVVQPGPAL